MISLSAAILIVALIVRDLTMPDKYIVDKSGCVVGITGDETGAGAEYQLELTMKNGEVSSSRLVTIRRRADTAEVKDNKIDDEELRAAEREAELNRAISDVELSSRKNVMLPSRLTDGTELVWSIPDSGSGDLPVIAIMYVTLVVMIGRSSLGGGSRDMVEKRASVLRNLPRFTNQLLLMMNAGVILSDAFSNICEAYKMIPESNRNSFERDMIETEENNLNHRISTATLLTEYASKYNSKEMMRIATILTENERRGSDVLESLQRESEFLWENRKITASERGKALDAKMVYPLGLLLIILIVITMAPAFLGM
ncbi:MAG: type II secretion system F family protein [Clostridiales bacterium]|nr:type II secretion system F family protein [Candidatus Crickella merdequi]